MEQDQSIIDIIINEQSQEEHQSIKDNGKLITLDDIHYARFSLYKKSSTESLHISSSIGTYTAPKLNHINFRLSDRGRDFHRNLPEDWQLSQSYNQAYDYFNRLTSPDKWIGKGTFNRCFSKKNIKMILCPLTAMVVEAVIMNNQPIMRGRCFIESAAFDFIFDIDNISESQAHRFIKHSEPIKIPIITESKSMVWSKI